MNQVEIARAYGSIEDAALDALQRDDLAEVACYGRGSICQGCDCLVEHDGSCAHGCTSVVRLAGIV